MLKTYFTLVCFDLLWLVVTLSVVNELCPVPTAFVAWQVYWPESLDAVLKMTREGDDVVLPLYLLALVLELMVVTILPLVLCQ